MAYDFFGLLNGVLLQDLEIPDRATIRYSMSSTTGV